MKNKTFSDNSYAASEVIGAIILVLIAVGAFAAIYYQVFPVPFPSPESHVKLQGYVTHDGKVVLEHVGGEPLTFYEIYVDGQLEYQNNSNSWVMGECYLPNIDALETADDRVRITVYSNVKDGSKAIVFDGILIGKGKTSVPPTGPAIAISSLKTNTSDEDLICYPSSIIPNIHPLTFIFNWTVDNNPINRLLFPFDTNNSTIAKDYSGNKKDGTIIGPLWINGGRVGGAYQFDGINDHISIPYCFDSSTINKITVETWVNTTANSGIIASFDRNNYWELGFINGKVRWSTTASAGLTDTIGKISINNGTWHHIATTYDYSTGECAIYVDGEQDTTEYGHRPGELLGLSGMPQGFIGTSAGVTRKTIFSTGFEKQEERNNWSENNSGAATGIKDYVDTLSNVSDPLDKGTHSKFDNEKAKDSSYDILTEGNTATGTTTTTLLNDGFEGGDWDANWDGDSNDWFRSDTHRNGSYSAGSRNNNEGGFSCDNLDARGATSIGISFWYQLDDTEDSDLKLDYYDGSNYDFIANIGGGTKNTWLHYTAIITDSQYFKSNFRIRFYSNLNKENVWVDDVLITKKIPGVNYVLDLEAQWTNVNYQLQNEELCIFTGLLGNETLMVDAWNGGGWVTIINPLLSSQWNNVSVTNWLTSPTFTIRYRDGTPTNDLTRNSWNIDAALLHLWTSQGVFDILSPTALNPRAGLYSIGGSGDFDPYYAAFNRTGIDVSGYKDVTLSAWYSYMSTDSNDKMGLYYKDGNNWVTIFEELNPQIGYGNQSTWKPVQIQIPYHIDNLVLQFRWCTSSTNEFVAIDDLEITGMPLGVGENYSGVLDEFRIYNRALSAEQIYQNYLCTKNGYSNTSVIVSEETANNENWRCFVIPNDSDKDDVVFGSETLLIGTYHGGE